MPAAAAAATSDDPKASLHVGGTFSKDAALAPSPSLYIMPRFEHGAILSRPAWCRRVKDAIDRVELAAAAWEDQDP